jgi:hypothetical protein
MAVEREFGLSDSENGLQIDLKNILQVHVMLRIVLRAKFPPDEIYDSEFLLSPFVEQLIDACVARLEKDPVERQRRATFEAKSPQPYFRSSDKFTKAVVEAVDRYITQYRIDPSERDALLRMAFKPHKVEGFF